MKKNSPTPNRVNLINQPKRKRKCRRDKPPKWALSTDNVVWFRRPKFFEEPELVLITGLFLIALAITNYVGSGHGMIILFLGLGATLYLGMRLYIFGYARGLVPFLVSVAVSMLILDRGIDVSSKAAMNVMKAQYGLEKGCRPDQKQDREKLVPQEPPSLLAGQPEPERDG